MRKKALHTGASSSNSRETNVTRAKERTRGVGAIGIGAAIIASPLAKALVVIRASRPILEKARIAAAVVRSNSVGTESIHTTNCGVQTLVDICHQVK